jgi:hypothetical protein
MPSYLPFERSSSDRARLRHSDEEDDRGGGPVTPSREATALSYVAPSRTVPKELVGKARQL